MKKRIAFSVIVAVLTVAVCCLCTSCDMIKGLFNKNSGNNIDRTVISDYADEGLVESISKIGDDFFDAMKTGILLQYDDTPGAVYREDSVKEIIVLTREDIINAVAEIDSDGARDEYRLFVMQEEDRDDYSREHGVVANNALREYLKDADITLEQLYEQETTEMTEKQEKAYEELMKNRSWSRLLGVDIVEDYMFSMWYEKYTFNSEIDKKKYFDTEIIETLEMFESEREYNILSKFDDGCILYCPDQEQDVIVAVGIMTDNGVILMHIQQYDGSIDIYRAASGN